MHPLLTAIKNLDDLRAIEPRPWGLYWPMWHRMYVEQDDFVRELQVSGSPVWGDCVYLWR
jgi:hypothetical protein